MLDVTVYLVEPMQRFFSTENYGEAGHTMLYAIWGGLLMGMGFGLIFRGGATTAERTSGRAFCRKG